MFYWFFARMQGFNWESCNKQGGWYNMLKGRVGSIASSGVTHVWLPPPSHSVSPQGKSTISAHRRVSVYIITYTVSGNWMLQI